MYVYRHISYRVLILFTEKAADSFMGKFRN